MAATPPGPVAEQGVYSQLQQILGEAPDLGRPVEEEDGQLDPESEHFLTSLGFPSQPKPAAAPNAGNAADGSLTQLLNSKLDAPPLPLLPEEDSELAPDARPLSPQHSTAPTQEALKELEGEGEGDWGDWNNFMKGGCSAQSMRRSAADASMRIHLPACMPHCTCLLSKAVLPA